MKIGAGRSSRPAPPGRRLSRHDRGGSEGGADLPAPSSFVERGSLKMERLATDQWLLQFYPDCIAVAAHINRGALYWTKLRLGDFPNHKSHPSSDFSKHLIGLNDLKGVIVELIDRRAID